MSARRLAQLVMALTFTAWANQLLADASTNRVVTFSLKDQFDNSLVLQPPFAKPVVVTIADKDGARELDSWIQPLKHSFPGQIQYFAVADLRSVPAPLRGLVRRGFRKEYTHPVALDWHGAVAGQLDLKKERANLLLLNASGHTIMLAEGAAAEPQLEQFKAGVRKLLQTGGAESAGDTASTGQP